MVDGHKEMISMIDGCLPVFFLSFVADQAVDPGIFQLTVGGTKAVDIVEDFGGRA